MSLLVDSCDNKLYRHSVDSLEFQFISNSAEVIRIWVSIAAKTMTEIKWLYMDSFIVNENLYTCMIAGR